MGHLLVKNNKGEGRRGLKRGELINLLPLKRRGGLLEREGLFERVRGGLLGDLSSVYSDAHLK